MKTSKVAVVDDHARVLDSVKQLLVAADFEVLTFRSAEEFLEYEAKHGGASICCLVLDVRLPGISGIELQTELKNRQIDIPIVLMSGHATREVIELGLKNGATALLEKPFDGEVLVEEVNKAITS